MQKYKYFEVPNEEDDILDIIDRDNPKCAFSQFIGNDSAVKKLQAVAYDALTQYDHRCSEIAFALFGPASSGKTTLAKLFAKVVDLPFVEISPKSIKTLDDVFDEINRILTADDVPLVEWKETANYYYLPPAVIFIDEIHAVSKSVIQGLLKATEYNDGMMVTESGKTLNCERACWMCATTDEGRLIDAFRTRFSSLKLTYLTKEEIAKVVKFHNPIFPDSICDLVAHYNSRIPRKALEFARYMKLIKGMDDKPWEEIVEEVAADEGIDKYGMERTHLRVLKALAQGPIAKNRMPYVVGSKLEEVENFVMPWLLTTTEESPALVQVGHAGYAITKAGMAELDKRSILHPPYEEPDDE